MNKLIATLALGIALGTTSITAGIIDSDDFYSWKAYETKDGNYYWVFATVFGYKSCDGKSGYISCRKFATDEEIKTHDELYKTMK